MVPGTARRKWTRVADERQPHLRPAGRQREALGSMTVTAKAETDEYRVMLDARDQLKVGDIPPEAEIAVDVDAWRGTIAKAPDAPRTLAE